MRRIPWLVLVVVGVGALVYVSLYVSPPDAETPHHPAGGTAGVHPPLVSEYELVALENLDFGTIRRTQARVSLPDHYQREAVEQIAKAVVTAVTESREVNAVSILFYGPHTSTEGSYDVAMIEWAPDGDWSEAATVQAGDYSRFRYSVVYNAPTSVSPNVRKLMPSGRTGLLGVLLPEGARLIEQTASNPAQDRDPSERYSIAGSDAQIIGFFAEAMPKAGWAKDGSSTNTAAFYRKGRRMIGVLTNKDGGTFTLMGS